MNEILQAAMLVILGGMLSKLISTYLPFILHQRNGKDTDIIEITSKKSGEKFEIRVKEGMSEEEAQAISNRIDAFIQQQLKGAPQG